MRVVQRKWFVIEANIFCRQEVSDTHFGPHCDSKEDLHVRRATLKIKSFNEI
jgi:hypothetical protein